MIKYIYKISKVYLLFFLLAIYLTRCGGEDNTISSGGQSNPSQRAASEGLVAIDATPTVDPLFSTPALIDNNAASSAGIDLNGANRNIGLKLTTAQSVFKMHLYVSTIDPNIAIYNFAWQLYTSSDGTNWTLMGVTTSWDSVNQRIVFTLSQETSAIYFKVVNTLFPAGALPINVTEIEAIG